MQKHREIVDKVAQSVKQFYKLQQPFRIFHGSTNSTRNPHTSPSVDTSSLSLVLGIDPVKKTVLVEPNVPMDRLVATTLQHNLIPPVVMEFPGITVGGGFAGTSGESSSFRHGFFDKTINSVEMVLGNGDVVIASPDNKHADLFHGAAGAVGSLGITTCIELQLIDAQPYVETTYYPVTSMKEAREQIAKATQDSALEYVDGIMFSEATGAVVTGRLVEHATPGVPVQHFSRPTDPWFYMHVQEQIEKTSARSSARSSANNGANNSASNNRDAALAAVTEIVPLEEYLFRYDLGRFFGIQVHHVSQYEIDALVLGRFFTHENAVPCTARQWTGQAVHGPRYCSSGRHGGRICALYSNGARHLALVVVPVETNTSAHLAPP